MIFTTLWYKQNVVCKEIADKVNTVFLQIILKKQQIDFPKLSTKGSYSLLEFLAYHRVTDFAWRDVASVAKIMKICVCINKQDMFIDIMDNLKLNDSSVLFSGKSNNETDLTGELLTNIAENKVFCCHKGYAFSINDLQNLKEKINPYTQQSLIEEYDIRTGLKFDDWVEKFVPTKLDLPYDIYEKYNFRHLYYMYINFKKNELIELLTCDVEGNAIFYFDMSYLQIIQQETIPYLWEEIVTPLFCTNKMVSAKLTFDYCPTNVLDFLMT